MAALAEHPEYAEPFAAATLAFGVHHEQPVLAWRDELPARLADVPKRPAQRAQDTAAQQRT